MGNLNIAMTLGDTALDLPFGWLRTTPNHQYQRSKKDLCGYHHQNYVAILVPEMGLFSKVCNKI